MQNWYTTLDLQAIQKKFGNASWLVSEEQLKENLTRLAVFTGDKRRICYPVKANPAIPVLQILAASGAGADCANMHEINLALLCGFKTDSIVYNAPVQDERTIHFVLEEGGTVVLDDPAVLQELNRDRYWETLPGKMWLRINPAASVQYEHKDNLQELMAHGSESSKFGVPEEEIMQVLSQVNLPICGLHLHVGTQMDNLQSFVTAIESLHRVAQQLGAIGYSIAHLDIGGGLGIPFAVGQIFPSIEAWAEALLPLKKKEYAYYAEPGHALVGDAVCLLTTVETIKKSRGKRWAVCNVGTDQLAKITLLKWEHPVYISDGNYLAHTGNDVLAGPLCFAGDVLLHATDVSMLSVHQPILVTRAGAYLFALSNAFNGRGALPWLVVRSNQAIELAVHKEEMFNRVFIHQTDWQLSTAEQIEIIDPERVKVLQSEYMTKLLLHDEYSFERFEKIGNKRYRVTSRMKSLVGFISMPLAIRILGDATIVAILHDAGANQKDHSVWGQKINLDYFANMSSAEPFVFIITLSEHYTHHGTRKLIASFETVKRGIQGMVVAHH